MRKVIFVGAWVFVFAAAIYDAYFAWQLRDLIHTWEGNPVARWAVAEVGLLAFIGCKFGGLLFAAGVAIYCIRRQRKRLAWPLTLTCCAVYALLSLHYIVNVHSPLYAATPVQTASR